MVPKVAGKGTSFKGAGQYYLHDKKADSAERVAFTHTLNLPTDDPELALRHMAYTAMHQDELKARAGVKATGRKSAQSVYTYSLSWAPDEQPTREEMIEAGRESLKALGLEGHEVLMVAHNDEPHPHLHVIVNRVDPRTGIMAPLKKDFLTLSKWAEAYERRQGEIRCEQRVENNEKRRKGQFVKYRDGKDAADLHRWRKQRGKDARYVRQAEAKNLSAHHAGQRQALYDEKEGRIARQRREILEQNRPEWAALFRAQEAEKKKLKVQQGGALIRAITTAGRRQGRLEALEARHKAERDALKGKVRQQTRAVITEVNKGYQNELSALRRTQIQERQALQHRHSRESQDMARAIKEGAGEQRPSIQMPAEKAIPRQPAQPKPPTLDLRLDPPIGPARDARQLKALEAEREELIEQRMRQIKEINRPQWAALFRQQREDRRELAAAQKTPLSRLYYWSRHPGLTKWSGRPHRALTEAARVVLGLHKHAAALEAKHEAERLTMARSVREQKDAAVRDIDNTYDRKRVQLLQAHAREAAAYRKETGQIATNEFERSAWEKIRKARERREEEKQRGRDRDGGRER